MSVIRRKRKKWIFRSERFSSFFLRNTEAERFAGNAVTLLPDGGDFFEDLLRAIRHARRYILLEFYIIRSDCAGCFFADALMESARRGVQVFLLYDYIGCFDTSASYFRHLQNAGIRCVPFNPPSFRRGVTWFDRRDHRKMAIIDGESAFVGGLNIGDEYAGYGDSLEKWRDVGMRVEGPAVRGFHRIFREAWEGEGQDVHPLWEAPPSGEARGEAELIIVSGGPHHTRSYIRSAYRMAIAGASETVKVLNPYFIPGPRVIRSLLRAASRGVRVQLILPFVCDVPLVRAVSRGYFLPLLKAGVEIYEREGTVLHAKAMLIDDCWAVFGSANLDYRSFHRNYEINVIVDSADFGRQVEEMVGRDLARSRRVTLDEHERRVWSERLMGMLFSPLSRFL